MAIKFMTNTVKVGKVKSFADLVQEKISKIAADQEATVKTAAVEEDEDDADADADTDEEVEEVEASAKKTVKTAEETEEEEEAEVEEKKSKPTAAKAKGSAGEADSSGQLKGEPNHQKGESVKPSAVTCENKKTEAKTSPVYVKVAKLDAKTRTMLKSYWSNLYPAEFVEAMLTDQ